MRDTVEWLLLDPSAGWIRLTGSLLATSLITGIIYALRVLEQMDDEES